MDSATFFAAPGYVDRLISNRVAKAAFGDSTVAKRQFGEDPQIRRAVELLRKGGTQRDLFSLSDAPGTAPARRP